MDKLKLRISIKKKLQFLNSSVEKKILTAFERTDPQIYHIAKLMIQFLHQALTNLVLKKLKKK